LAAAVPVGRAYGGKAGLGVLAAFSLLMMLMMVRKVSEGPVLPGEEPPKQLVRIITKKQAAQMEEQEEPDVLTVNGPPVGEAEAHEDLLVGREVDEATLRVQQVVQQVADMVKEDPKTSASILQRWIQVDKQ
jgi:flagellar biosynthesis/type III secretory pathway M-ring protein FliF/YscJ